MLKDEKTLNEIASENNIVPKNLVNLEGNILSQCRVCNGQVKL